MRLNDREAQPFPNGEQRLLTSAPDQVAGDIKAFADIGVRHFMFTFQSDMLEATLARRKCFVTTVKPTTVIIARTSALAECPLDEALDRIRAYSDTGAEALMLVGAHRGRRDLEAVHQVTTLPLCVLNPPPDVRNDSDFLAAHGVRLLMLGNPTFAVAVQAIYDSLKHLKDGGSLEELHDRQASPALWRSVNRTDEFIQQQQTYFP